MIERVLEKYRISQIILFISSILFVLAMVRVHLQTETILMGYDLGSMKGNESQLQEKQSQLKMKLSKLHAKGYLEAVSHNLETIEKGKVVMR